jgi:glycosyltransferase involved in cell wall biosynthesis
MMSGAADAAKKGGEDDRSIAIVNASGRIDGITQSLEPYRDSLSRLGYRVTWYQCVDSRGGPDSPPGEVRVSGTSFPLPTLAMGINRLWTFPRRLRGLRERIVLLGDPTLARVRPSGGQTVVYVHDLRPLSEYSDRWVTSMLFHRNLAALRAVPRIIVPSEFVRMDLIRRGFTRDRVRVVPETHSLGFHPDHIERSRQRLIHDRETRVLFVGTDRPYKNVDFVLDLAREAGNRKGHRYSFTLVSDLRRSTERRISELGLKHVTAASHVDSLATVYDSHDVLLFPSLYEGFGRPLVEAMAFGLPILANRIGPVGEVLGDAGTLLEPGDHGAWLSALTSLEDPATYERDARRSLERGREFLPDKFETQLRSALELP